MGSVTDTPTIINNLEVPERLFVAGTAEFTQGSTQDNIKTKIVYSDPSDDLDLVGRTGVLGTTGAIRIGSSTVGFFANTLGPVATVNTDRFSCEWVENDKNGLQSTSLEFTPTTVVVTVDNVPISTFNSDRLSCTWVENDKNGQANTYSEYLPSSIDFYVDGTKRGDITAAGFGIDSITASDIESTGFLKGLVVRTNIIQGTSGQVLRLSADEAPPGLNHAGIEMSTNQLQIYDGSTINRQINFSSGGMFSDYPAFANISYGASLGFLDSGGYPLGTFKWGSETLSDQTDGRSVIYSPNSMAFNIAAGDIDGITVLQAGVYRVSATLICLPGLGTSIQITKNGIVTTTSQLGINEGFQEIFSIQDTVVAAANDIFRISHISGILPTVWPAQAAEFRVQKFGGNFDVNRNGVSLGAL